MKKVKLVGYLGDTNLGDQILADSAEYLVGKYNGSDIEISKLDLLDYFKYSLLDKFKNKIGLVEPPRNLVERKIRRIDKKDFKDIDAIIFVGGGMIKYFAQDCWKHVSIIIGIAEELSIPVYMHAVGVEGYDDRDERCSVLKNYLNKSVVKKIATRDDIDILNSHYVNSNIVTELVADSAVHCDKVYNITKKTSEIIGVGLVRGNIFSDHGKKFLKRDVINLYSQLINELEKRNIQYQLFTNGLSLDEELLEDIEKETGLKLSVIVPNSSKELVSTISSFKGVVAARLHACIISYSLDVPVVGLVWNNKLAMFGKHIGYPNRFLETDSFNPEKIIRTLDDAIDNGYASSYKLDYTKSVITSMENTLKDITSGS